MDKKIEPKWHESAFIALFGMSFLIAAALFYHHTVFSGASSTGIDVNKIPRGLLMVSVVIIAYPVLGAVLAYFCEWFGSFAHYVNDDYFLKWDFNERTWFAVFWPGAAPVVFFIYLYVVWFSFIKKIFS